MKTSVLLDAAMATLALSFATAWSEEVAAPAPLGKPAAAAYRQTTPDGRVIYSDKPLKGAKVDETVEPPPKGSVWLSESGKRPPAATQVERKTVTRVGAIPGARRSVEEATSEVIRAEMLLEDARRRQQAGMAPQPGERAGEGAQADDARAARLRALAKDVADAEAALGRAQAERDALAGGR